MENFLLEEGHIIGIERVVFHTPVPFHPFRSFPTLPALNLICKESRIEKNPDRHRHSALMNQVVKYDGHAQVTRLAHVGMTVLKHHQGGRLGAVILRGNVQIPLSQGAIEDGASPLMPGHLASGNTILTLRVGSEIKRWLFLLVAMKRGQTVADQEEGDDVFTTHGKGPGPWREHSLLIPSCRSALKNCPTQLMSRWHPSPIWLSDEPLCQTSFGK